MSIADKLGHAELDNVQQKHDFRPLFIYWSLALMSAAVLLNFATMGLYLRSQWNNLADGVMIAWFAATIVEVLGLGYIVANYLVDGKGKSTDMHANKD